MIKAGDTVFLKSGGPEMTVGKVSFFGKAKCTYWYETKTKDWHSASFRERVFHVDALEVTKAK